MLNLNLNQYTNEELKDIFDLPKKYNTDNIISSCNLYKISIENNKTIDNITKENTLIFIEQAKQRLINNISTNTLTNSNIISAGNTDIIKHKNAEYLYSAPSEYFAGTINPLNKRITRQNINIDTRFRNNYNITQSTNYHLTLPLQLTKVVSMQLSAIDFPMAIFPISEAFGNNYFYIKNETESLLINIPDGNYYPDTLTNYINNILSTDATFNYIQFSVIDNNNTLTGENIIGRMQASSSNNDTFTLDFSTKYNGSEDKTPLPLKFGWMMGYREETYEGKDIYPSEGLIDLRGPRYMYLAIDDYNNNVNDGFYATFNSSILNKNILTRINLTYNSSFMLSQDNLNLVTTPRQYFGPVNIEKMQIQLLDEYGRILNLNKMDYSFCLTFQTIYDL